MQPESNQDCQARPMGIGESRGATCAPPPSQPYDINISKAENGFVVVVGCKRFVFSEWVLVSEALALYYKNPEEAIKKYCRT